jgi:hypothetical protein
MDATAEVHWLYVVSGVKWVFVLPPTVHNRKIWNMGKHDTERSLRVLIPI